MDVTYTGSSTPASMLSQAGIGYCCTQSKAQEALQAFAGERASCRSYAHMPVAVSFGTVWAN